MNAYQKLLQHPKWQKKRLKILQRDNFQCQLCRDRETTLHIHHLEYKKGNKPWEYEMNILLTVCKDCHKAIHDLQLDVEQIHKILKRIHINNDLPFLFILKKDGSMKMCDGSTEEVKSFTQNTVKSLLKFLSNEYKEIEIIEI